MNRKNLVWIVLALCLVLLLGLAGCVAAPLQPEVEAAPATITGMVVDVNGAAVEGASVSVEGQTVSSATATDGSFTLTGVEPGFVYLYVTAPSASYVDGETLQGVLATAGETSAGVEITLSGRPSDEATYVGMETCQDCHGREWETMFAALDGSAGAAAHSRFVTEGTSHLVYPEMWPAPGDKFLPRNPKGELLMVQDPVDAAGLVNVVLCTRDGEEGRGYLFKFYPELAEGTQPRTDDELDCTEDPSAVFIPVAATIGGEGNWGEGYADPAHAVDDRYPNFGEGKQRYMARIQDVPFLVTWMEENGVPLERAKQDYVAYLPVYVVQDGTPAGSDMVPEGKVGVPKFWQKSPDHWATPDNTISRNCAGCHTTGLQIDYQDFTDGEETYKAVVTAYDYVDANVTCERCHGPGSEHADSRDAMSIISPQYLTAQAGNELCGQCHASHAGKSATPSGAFKFSYDATYEETLGYGTFIAGIHDLETFIANYNVATPANDWKVGSFHSWPDQVHSAAHSQMMPEFLLSDHANNPYEKLTCSTCHNAHTLDGGPATLTVDGFAFASPAYSNNTLCLVCHAGHGPFEDVLKADVAVLQVDGGGQVSKESEVLAFEVTDAALARNRVAKAVAQHMQAEAGMGGAIYTPADPAMPVGNCTSCHMAKIGKLQDVNDDTQYHLAPDGNGLSAVAEGNVASHVFDIVWPAQSAILKNPDPSVGHDYDIMPNSCSNCHDFARISGDND